MEQSSNNQGKKKFQIKIAGFTFGIKFFVIIGIIILIIIVSQVKKKSDADKAAAAANAEVEATLAAVAAQSSTETEFNVHDEIQKSLADQFGDAPDGFEWSYTGELVALGNDDSSTAEDVVYMFLRSLSILDFSTASKYSDDSDIIASYESFYTNYGVTNYYNNFLRKQFKKSITSLEVNNITDTAVFADGTEYLTVSINILDLTDKDFWLSDKDNLYQTLRVYQETEEDNTKLNQYVYDYIYTKYEDGTIGKRTLTIELVVSKENGGGWLVSGDNELNAALQYENGVDVAQYILDSFSDWYQDITLKEQLDEVQKTLEDVQESTELEEE